MSSLNNLVKSSQTGTRFLALACVLVTAACGSGAPAASTSPATSTAPAASAAAASKPAAASGAGSAAAAAKPSASGAAGFDAEWASLMAAAKQEGKLSVGFTTNPPLVDQVLPAFQKKFGVNIEVTQNSNGNELVNKLVQEKAAGVHSLDVYISATSATAIGVDANLYAPLKPQLIIPDVNDSSKWAGGKPWFFDKGENFIVRIDRQLRYFFAINSKTVDASQIKTPQDLLDPRWKGKIAAIDSTVPSAGQSIAADILKIMGEDYLTKLYVGQQVKYTTDQRVLGNWVAQNAYPIGIALPLDELANMKQTGLSVSRLRIDQPPMASTTSVLYFGIVDKPQHPNAAKLLANWLLTQEAMQIIVDAEGYVVTRTDVNYSKLDPDNTPTPGVNYFDEGTSEYITGEKQQLVEKVGQLLKH